MIWTFLSLVKQALERGKDVALKQAEKTAAQNPQETPTEDKNKLLEKTMLWNQKNRDPSYKAKTSWNTGTVLDGSSSEAHGGDIRTVIWRIGKYGNHSVAKYPTVISYGCTICD